MLNALKVFWMANKSPMMFGFGMGGIFLTAAATGEACVKADHVLEKMHYESETEPTRGEKAKAVLPLFIKPAILGLGTGLSFAAAREFDHNKLIAATSLGVLAKESEGKIEEKAKELLGEKKMQKVKDGVATENCLNDPPKKECIFYTGHGNTIFRDVIMGGSDFASDIESVKAAFNKAQSMLNDGDYVTMTDLLYLLDRPSYKMAQEIGWPPYARLEPYLTSVDLTKDLQEVTSNDLTEMFAIGYNLPGLLPDM